MLPILQQLFFGLLFILSWPLCGLLHVSLLKYFHKEHYWKYDGSFYMVYILGPIGLIISVFEFTKESAYSKK